MCQECSLQTLVPTLDERKKKLITKIVTGISVYFIVCKLSTNLNSKVTIVTFLPVMTKFLWTLYLVGTCVLVDIPVFLSYFLFVVAFVVCFWQRFLFVFIIIKKLCRKIQKQLNSKSGYRLTKLLIDGCIDETIHKNCFTD